MFDWLKKLFPKRQAKPSALSNREYQKMVAFIEAVRKDPRHAYNTYSPQDIAKYFRQSEEWGYTTSAERTKFSLR
mgnify:CR=1 FL=1